MKLIYGIETSHSHNPSCQRTRGRIWWDFLLHSTQLYDRRTNTAKCKACGVTLKVPSVFGKEMPVRAFLYSACTTICYYYLLWFLRMKLSWSIAVCIVVATALGLCFFFFQRRIHAANLLAFGEWSEIVASGEINDGILQVLLKAEAADENRRIRRAELFGFAIVSVICSFLNQY